MAKKSAAIIDERNYRTFCVVEGPWETLTDATARAERLKAEWLEIGRRVPAAVLYRDGSVVSGSLTDH